MEFKEKFKFLRKQKGLTQEDLAEWLGVSFQTVSKWENGISMPDINMLPIMADFFEISIDELLGYCANDRRMKSADIAKEAHSLTEKGHFLEAYQFLERKAKYFKLDIGVQHLMGFMAYQHAKRTEGEEKVRFLNIAIRQSEMVMKLDQNDSSRTAQAKLLKCYCFKEMGNQKIALEMAGKLPSMFSSREVALFRCTEGEEKRRCAELLEKNLEELQKEIIELS